jgi:hypothetical protein
MNDDNVIPFRKRSPSKAEMDAYRQMTRRWTDASKQLLMPDHFRAELASRAEPAESQTD